MDDKEAVLVCAIADQPLMLAQSTFDRQCSKCAARVMVSQWGQSILRRNAGVKILCTNCFRRVRPEDVEFVLPTAEQVQELRRPGATQPNNWKLRN